MGFIQQAYSGKNNWWRWALVTTLVLIPFIYKVSYFFIHYHEPFQQITSKTNYYLATIFFSYVPSLFVLFLGIKFLHKRQIRSLISADKKIDWWRFIFGLSAGGLFVLLYFSINYFNYPSSYEWNFNLIPFLELVVICIFLVPLGAIFKELFFRGYLLQGLSIFLKSKFKALILISFVYMILMGANPTLKSVGFEILFFYFSSSILTGLIVLLDERLELAIGIRITNNIFRLLYVTTIWSPLKTNALLLDVSKPRTLYLIYIPVFIFFPLFLLFLKHMYGWANFKEKIFGKVY